LRWDSGIARGSAHSRDHLNDAHQKKATLNMAFGADESASLQDVENRSTLGSAASRHLVNAPLVWAGAATSALGDTDNDADAGTIELVAQDPVPPSRHRLARKCIEVEGSAVHIESFVF